VEDLDRQVLALLAEHLLDLLLEDPAGPVMRIDNGVADLEVDALDLTGLKALQERLFSDVGSDGVLLVRLRRCGESQVCR